MLGTTVRLVATVLTGLALSAPAMAANITWTPAAQITSDADVVTVGTLDRAYNFGAGGVTDTTVNGVTFTAFPSPGIRRPSRLANTSITGTTGQNIVNAFNGYSSGNPPYSLLSAGYKSLISTGVYNDGGALDPHPERVDGRPAVPGPDVRERLAVLLCQPHRGRDGREHGHPPLQHDRLGRRPRPIHDRHVHGGQHQPSHHLRQLRFRPGPGLPVADRAGADFPRLPRTGGNGLPGPSPPATAPARGRGTWGRPGSAGTRVEGQTFRIDQGPRHQAGGFFCPATVRTSPCRVASASDLGARVIRNPLDSCAAAVRSRKRLRGTAGAGDSSIAWTLRRRRRLSRPGRRVATPQAVAIPIG